MRSLVVALRLVRQLVRDRRTLAMLFVAPVVILLLMQAVFASPTLTLRFDEVNVPTQVVQALQGLPNTAVKSVSAATATADLVNGRADAELSFDAGSQTFKVTVEGSQPTITAQTLNKMRELQALLGKQTSAPSPTATTPGTGTAAGTAAGTTPGTTTAAAAATATVHVNYLHGGSEFTTLDYFAPVLIGFFIFLFVFILSGVSFLRERTTGTLERALVTPLTRAEMVVGYLFGFGGFAVLQTLVIQSVAVYGLKVTHVGSLWVVTLFNLLLAIVALSLGMLLSAFARTELQMLQFIPLVIVPQIFLSGIFELRGMPQWLLVLSKLFPLTYAANALRGVMIRGDSITLVWPDAVALAAYAALFLLLTVVALRKYRGS